MMNLAPTSDVWADPIAVPDEGEDVNAALVGIGEGPVRPGFQALLNRIWSLVRGKVSIRAMLIQAGDAVAVAPADGNLQVQTLVLCPNFLGDQTQMQNYSEVFNLLAPIGRGRLLGGSVAFTSVTNGASGGNPPRTQPLTNELRPLLAPKAWAIVRTADAGYPGLYVDGANFAAGSFAVAGGPVSTFTFAMASAMSSTEYLVIPAIRHLPSGAFIGWSNITRISSTQFSVSSAVDFAAINYEIEVLVFGRQT